VKPGLGADSTGGESPFCESANSDAPPGALTLYAMVYRLLIGNENANSGAFSRVSETKAAENRQKCGAIAVQKCYL
jgi:hypothetical protein